MAAVVWPTERHGSFIVSGTTSKPHRHRPNSTLVPDTSRQQFKDRLKSWLFECAYDRRRVYGLIDVD